jgi:hypothetical protein
MHVCMRISQEVLKRLMALIDDIGAKEGGKAFLDPVSIPKYTGESLTAIQVRFEEKQHDVDPGAKISPHFFLFDGLSVIS